MGILEFISEALYDASEESGFYELGYSRRCGNYYDMYNDAQTELSKAFKRILKDKLSTMTNGDVIKALFPNALYSHDDSHDDYADKFVSFGVGVTLKDSFGEWWNAPYKREGE